MLYRGMRARACVTKSCVAQIIRAEQRRQDAFNQYSMAKQRLAQIEQEHCGRGSDVANDLTTEIDLTDRQTSASLTPAKHPQHPACDPRQVRGEGSKPDQLSDRA